MERQALYTGLRFKKLLNPGLEVDEWKVTDYRALDLEDIFDQLDELDIEIDPNEFLDLANDYDTPEDLIQDLAEDLDGDQYDQASLLLFELWRRLLPEKLCLSIFCDELDHQVFLYEQRFAENEEAIEDILANLEMLLDDYTDQGASPIQVFQSVTSNSATDIENFLYDYIATQINSGNSAYAAELIESFEDYVTSSKWFNFYRARLMADIDPLGSNLILRDLVEDAEGEYDLEFNFALLTFLIQQGDQDLFRRIVKVTVPLLEVEEDFQDLLSITVDHLRLLDLDREESEVQAILDSRSGIALNTEFNSGNKDIETLYATLKVNA